MMVHGGLKIDDNSIIVNKKKYFGSICFFFCFPWNEYFTNKITNILQNFFQKTHRYRGYCIIVFGCVYSCFSKSIIWVHI